MERDAHARTPGRHERRVGHWSGLWERTKDWVDENFDGDLSLHGLHRQLLGGLATAVAVAGIGVDVADEVFGLHLGRDMAGVVVERSSNVTYRTLEEAVHDVGKTAEQFERGK